MKYFSRLSLVCVFGVFFACGQISKSDQISETTLPEPLISASPAAESTPRPFEPKLDIGIALAGTKCSKLLISNTDLEPGEEIQVVLADYRPHKTLLATVVGQNNCPPSPKSAIQEIVIYGDDSPPTEYEIRFADKDERDSGFAVISAKASVAIKKGVANLTASNLPTPLVFRTCSGNESYHMTVWEGKPLVGKRVWYSYWSLSYGTVFTCKPADYK
jgi:hypothetical protein